MAGFGGGGSSSTNKKKSTANSSSKPTKLKPRQQWDRFLALKTATPIRVAVQTSTHSDKWYAVGEVKSKDDQYTEYAIIRQRVLMAEHARRLFPVQILTKDTLTWGYDDSIHNKENEDTTAWTVVTSVASADMPDDIDKQIGFKGDADVSGFYAHAYSDKGLKAGDSHNMNQVSNVLTCPTDTTTHSHRKLIR